ncbi:adenosine deaminase [Levilactobacillus namurensis]|uniref:adenosine deaminase n=1 Tax=Levilactobacillus namurensis TaxID=380393 RepID=A0AAW8VZJ6_9LACO|nr:adenosine deaminase [Levilactobacillus namurensis]MDT7013111.1 adenosine deaminase [Levilactobacillus namurensis]
MSQVTPFTASAVRQFPKVELHCHLDGSLSLPALRQMAAVTGDDLPASDAALRQLVSAPMTTVSLIDYLKRFQVVTDLMQTTRQLEIAGYDMVRTAAADGLIYLETRFAPSLFTDRGLTLAQGIQSILTGLHRGTADFGVPVNAIICAMRDQPNAESASVFRTAAEFADQGVVGFDFAGDEAHHPTSDLTSAIQAGLATGLPCTLHAGEAGPAQNVADALTLGAQRIGHGVHMSQHPAVIAQAKAAHATIETCLTSNLQTKAVAGYADFPLSEFLSAGLAVTINTDDRTVSQTDLTTEIMALHTHYGLDWSLLTQLTRNAIDGAFIPADQKAALWRQVQATQV